MKPLIKELGHINRSSKFILRIRDTNLMISFDCTLKALMKMKIIRAIRDKKELVKEVREGIKIFPGYYRKSDMIPEELKPVIKDLKENCLNRKIITWKKKMIRMIQTKKILEIKVHIIPELEEESDFLQIEEALQKAIEDPKTRK